MLVVTANWAFTDGSLWQSAARIEPWIAAVHRAALRGGFQRDGSYRPAKSLDIVFAGDTFDGLASRRWTGGIRPWRGGAAAAAARGGVLLAAASRGRRLFARLARWCRDGLPVPAADRHGRPLPHFTERAAVRLTLLAGDRDRWLDVAGDVAGRHGCAVGRIWAGADVVVRHAADLDPVWAVGDAEAVRAAAVCDRQPLLGESLAVDLLVRFAATLPDGLISLAPIRRLLSLLGATRPLDIPAVFSGWLDATQGGRSLPAATLATLDETWQRAVAAWHRQSTREPPACGIEASPVDALAAWLRSAGRDAGGGMPTVRARLDLLEPRIARPPSGMTSVLGHLAAPAGSGSDSAGLVCLGGPVSRTMLRVTADWFPLAVEPEQAAVVGSAAASEPAGGNGGFGDPRIGTPGIGNTVVDAIPVPAGRAA